MLQITDEEFDKIKDIMFRRTGVFLKPTKKPLVVTRLRKRLEELQLEKFSNYVLLLENPQSPEFESFVNAITTNETYFFRHQKQFDYLRDVLIPHIREEKKKLGRPGMRIWSAACSTGEEPYSIAMLCNEYSLINPGMTFSIQASDVNSEVLRVSKEGIYFDRSLRETPEAYKKKYFLQKTEEKINRSVFELDQKVKRLVEFRQHNLLKPPFQKNVDVVFLRNVMIYFKSETKQKVVDFIEQAILPGGYLFISLSESLNDIQTKFKFVQSGIYQKS